MGDAEKKVGWPSTCGLPRGQAFACPRLTFLGFEYLLEADGSGHAEGGGGRKPVEAHERGNYHGSRREILHIFLSTHMGAIYAKSKKSSGC